MKGQPLAYNKDNQEDKEPLFDTVDTLKDTLRIFAEMVGGITVKPEAMERAALRGYATATDLADYLVKKGLPFRDAHETVAHAVKAAISHQVDLSELPLAVLQSFHPSDREGRVRRAEPARLAECAQHRSAAPRRRRCARRSRGTARGWAEPPREPGTTLQLSVFVPRCKNVVLKFGMRSRFRLRRANLAVPMPACAVASRIPWKNPPASSSSSPSIPPRSFGRPCPRRRR